MINYDIIIDTRQKNINNICARNVRFGMHHVSRVHADDTKEKKERRIERERALLSRTQQVYICCRRVRGCVPVVWEGVVLQVREREQHKVRVSGEVAHPENHG